MRRITSAVLVLLLSVPITARAVILNGVMVYATDDFGTPNRWDIQKEAFTPGQLWRTQLGGEWYGLGLLPDLPPGSVDAELFNAPDFSIQIPLSEGENDFTMVGESGPLTPTDDYTRFSVNLYFDGVLDRPGISVLVPRYAPLSGVPPLPNVRGALYALSLAPAKGPAEATYSDGTETVSIAGVSFLPPDRSRVDYDKVQAYRTVPSETDPGLLRTSGCAGLGCLDYVGVLKISVEGLGGSAPIGVPGPGAFGVVPGGAVVGPDMGGVNPVGDAGASLSQPGAATPRSGQQPVIATGNSQNQETEPTAGEQTPSPVETPASPATTPTRRATGLATPALQATPTAVAVPVTASPAVKVSGSGASVATPTAAAPRPATTPSRRVDALPR